MELTEYEKQQEKSYRESIKFCEARIAELHDRTNKTLYTVTQNLVAVFPCWADSPEDALAEYDEEGYGGHGVEIHTFELPTVEEY